MTRTSTERPRTGTPPRHVGRPADRVDGTAKTTGAARFSAEYPYPDLAHAALVHATVARGRITGIATAAARAVDGVLAVLTHENAPGPPARRSRLDFSGMIAATSVDYLHTDEVHWNGQPVAVVVAETPEAARHAARLVRVTYEPLPATVDFAAEEGNAVPRKGGPMAPGTVTKGDAEAALAAAPVSVDLRFTTPPYHHNAIEPHATTAVWDGDRLTVHETTQAINWTRKYLARRFGVPVSAVRVVSPYVGGGFGGKGMVWPGTVLTVLAARAVGRPVRMALTREGVYHTVGGRTPSVQRVAIGAHPGGAMTALVHTSVTRVGRVGGRPEPVTALSGHLYDAGALLLQQNLVELDLLANTFMRAPGEAIGSFALESAVDELARELGIDPIELRMRNEPAANPADGKAFSRRLLREAYALGAERFGWSRRTDRPARDGRWLVGMGVATAYHLPVQLNANLAVRLSVDGSVVVRCGFQEMGMGGATVIAQIAADALGVPLESVTVEYGDSDLPPAPMAAGSAQTASVAAALLEACEKLKRSVLRLAAPGSPLRGQRPDRVEARDGGLHPIDRPDAGESWAAVLARAGRPSVEAEVGGAAHQVRFAARFLRDRRRWVKAALGAHFCEVRVDPDTCEVRVTRWTGVFDAGRVINPKTAASQIRGGVVMGIGMALSEHTLLDPRTGRIVNPSLSGYHVAVHADVPPIDVHFLDEPDPTTPLGLVGLGEVGITGAAAVANAVRHATGRRVTGLPITPDKLL